jgi:hypothetical protein
MHNKSVAIEQMLPKETERVNKLRDMYGYYNFQSHNELLRMI